MDDSKLRSIEVLNVSESSMSVNEFDLQVPTYLGLKGERLNFAITSICSVGFLLFGYDQGLMGSLLTQPGFCETFPIIDPGTNAANSILQGLTVASYGIGCVVSSLSTIYLGDKLGRVKLMFLGLIIIIIGGILQSTAVESITFLIIARFITGLGNGLNTATVPLYQSETSKAHNRGMLICYEGGFIALGVCFGYWIDFAFYFSKNQTSWRIPIAFQCIFPLMMCPYILKLPESPRLLMRRGNFHEAKRVFAALYQVPINDQIVDEQIRDIEEALEFENKTSGKSFFSQGETKNFQRTCLALFCQFMQQICGIHLTTYYAGTFLETHLGLSPLISRVISGFNGTEYFFALVTTILLVEKIGRRPLFIGGVLGQAAVMAAISVTMYLTNYENSLIKAYALAFLLFIFNTCYGLSLLSLCWLYPPEISPLNCRAGITGLSTAVNWLTSAMVAVSVPIMFERFQYYYTFAIFAAINFLMIPVLYVLYPETKGRSLEEMDIIFAMTSRWQPWEAVSIAGALPKIHAGDFDDIESQLSE